MREGMLWVLNSMFTVAFATIALLAISAGLILAYLAVMRLSRSGQEWQAHHL